jgi:hypothetical protein
MSENVGASTSLNLTGLHGLYSDNITLPYITMKSRRMRWAGHLERMGEMMNACRILVRKSEGKRPLRRLTRRRWVDNIKMDIREMGWYGLD